MTFQASRIGWLPMAALAIALLGACDNGDIPTTAEEVEAQSGEPAEAKAQSEEEPAPIATELITERAHEFTDDVAAQIRVQPEGRRTEVVNMRDATHIVVAEVTIQPGAWFPWHTHPGLALAVVKEGDLVYIYSDDCVERPYAGGQSAFIDPGHGNVHTAYNPSENEETVVIVTFLGAPAEGPLTIPEDRDVQEDLDEHCGVTTPRP